MYSNTLSSSSGFRIIALGNSSTSIIFLVVVEKSDVHFEPFRKSQNLSTWLAPPNNSKSKSTGFNHSLIDIEKWLHKTLTVDVLPAPVGPVINRNEALD